MALRYHLPYGGTQVLIPEVVCHVSASPPHCPCHKCKHGQVTRTAATLYEDTHKAEGPGRHGSATPRGRSCWPCQAAEKKTSEKQEGHKSNTSEVGETGQKKSYLGRNKAGGAAGNQCGAATAAQSTELCERDLLEGIFTAATSNHPRAAVLTARESVPAPGRQPRPQREAEAASRAGKGPTAKAVGRKTAWGRPRDRRACRPPYRQPDLAIKMRTVTPRWRWDRKVETWRNVVCL